MLFLPPLPPSSLSYFATQLHAPTCGFCSLAAGLEMGDALIAAHLAWRINFGATLDLLYTHTHTHIRPFKLCVCEREFVCVIKQRSASFVPLVVAILAASRMPLL